VEIQGKTTGEAPALVDGQPAPTLGTAVYCDWGIPSSPRARRRARDIWVGPSSFL